MAKQSRSAVTSDGLMAWEGSGATMWLTATRGLNDDRGRMRRAAAAVIDQARERSKLMMGLTVAVGDYGVDDNGGVDSDGGVDRRSTTVGRRQQR